jgi:hypothetical protein
LLSRSDRSIVTDDGKQARAATPTMGGPGTPGDRFAP